ncbi:MAG: ABC transporter permease [Bacteroidales bacterium]|nr:ABC transporter permease [Bacteroidales bacterium]MDD6668292.1 ABC transporter permease [Bacteroidales bacterium]
MKKIKEYIVNALRHCIEEVRMTMKDQGALIFLFFVPLVYPLIYASIYDAELVNDVPLVVVDNSRTSKSRSLVRKIDATQGIKVAGYAADMQEAREALAEKACFGVVLIERDFGTDIGRGERGDVTLFCDMSLLVRYKSLLIGVTEATLDLGHDIQVESLGALGADGPKLPPVYTPSFYALGNPQQGFATFLMPGILMLVLQQTILLTLCLLGGGLYERRRANGWISSYLSTPIAGGATTRLLGKSMAYFIVYFGQLIYMLCIVPHIFSYPQEAGFVEILALSVPYIFAVVMLGMTLHPFVRERESVFLLVVFTSVLMVFLSGITWPVYAFPKWLKFLSGMLPSTWSMHAFERLNADGASLAEVSHEIYMLWILAACFFMTAVCANKWSQLRRR